MFSLAFHELCSQRQVAQPLPKPSSFPLWELGVVIAVARVAPTRSHTFVTVIMYPASVTCKRPGPSPHTGRAVRVPRGQGRPWGAQCHVCAHQTCCCGFTRPWVAGERAEAGSVSPPVVRGSCCWRSTMCYPAWGRMKGSGHEPQAGQQVFRTCSSIAAAGSFRKVIVSLAVCPRLSPCHGTRRTGFLSWNFPWRQNILRECSLTWQLSGLNYGHTIPCSLESLM